MKITFLAIGKTDEEYIAEGLQRYSERLKHYTRFEVKEVLVSRKQALPADKQMEREAEAVIKVLKGTEARVMLLDERGKDFTSEGFAGFLQKAMLSGVKELYFVAGGPWGFHRKLTEQCREKISLSKMTLTHQMVRLLFAEQLYRAFTIIKGEKYHH